MKTTFKKAMTAIFATAMCAITMTSTMTANAAYEKILKTQDIQLADTVKVLKPQDKLVLDTASLVSSAKKASFGIVNERLVGTNLIGGKINVAEYDGELLGCGNEPIKIKKRIVLGLGGHWVIIEIKGQVIMIWVPNEPEPINPRAWVEYAFRFKDKINEFVKEKVSLVDIKHTGIREQKVGRVNVLDLSAKVEYTATIATAQTRLTNYVEMDRTAARELLVNW